MRQNQCNYTSEDRQRECNDMMQNMARENAQIHLPQGNQRDDVIPLGRRGSILCRHVRRSIRPE